MGAKGKRNAPPILPIYFHSGAGKGLRAREEVSGLGFWGFRVGVLGFGVWGAGFRTMKGLGCRA
jgi:hypothetical protein